MDFNNKVIIIAEAGINHNGSLETAKKMVDVAKECNVDAIKFQTFVSDEVVTRSAPKAEYQKVNSSGSTQYEMISALELTTDEFIILKEYCDLHKILFLSSPFGLNSLEFLISTLNVEAIKIPSGEITNAPLLYKAALSNKQIILSTGMSTLLEIEDALGVLAFGYLNKADTPSIPNFRNAYQSEKGKAILKEKVVLLHCVSSYPAPFDEVNLKALVTLKNYFGLPVGFSDHTTGIYASLGAICFNAKCIEKHFTLDKSQVGPDHSSSLSPCELKELVSAIRIMESCQGSFDKLPTKSEKENILICRRSLVTQKRVLNGEKFTEKSLCAKRPGNGISPMQYWECLGQSATKDYSEDEMII